MQAGTASAEPCPPEIEVEVEEHEDGEEADEDVEGADAGGSDSASAKKQRKNKSTRWNIPKSALQTLEQMFERDKFPSVETRKKLAQELNVTPRQVQVWFQNKRQRSVKPPATRNAPQGDRNYLSTSRAANIAGVDILGGGDNYPPTYSSANNCVGVEIARNPHPLLITSNHFHASSLVRTRSKRL
eukprot:scaffold10484_cov31-Tisochrysis_lutea.AAC.1